MLGRGVVGCNNRVTRIARFVDFGEKADGVRNVDVEDFLYGHSLEGGQYCE
jgi:hypothetical protein